jgi:hypothetical protein
MRQAGNFLTLHPTLARAFTLTSAAACLAAAEPALAAVADATTVTTAEPATMPATTTASATATADAPPPAVHGLFPLWEHTGVVEESGAARVGLRHMQVGLGPLTVGTDPYLDIYGTMNATAKLGLMRDGPLRLALQASWLRVPTAAETRGVGNLHAGAFANPYAPVTLLPVAAGVTWLAARRVHLHASATLLQTLSAAPELQATVRWHLRLGRVVDPDRPAASGCTQVPKAGRSRRRSTSAFRSAGGRATSRSRAATRAASPPRERPRTR